MRCEEHKDEAMVEEFVGRHRYKASVLANRFQCQPWYVRLWRRRYYWHIPHQLLRYAADYYWRALKDYLQGPPLPKTVFLPNLNDKGERISWELVEDQPMTPRQYYGLLLGLAQSKMEWWWTSEEVEKRLGLEPGELP